MIKKVLELRSFALLSLFCALSATAGMQSRVDHDALRPLRADVKSGARVQLRDIVVGDTIRTLDLERFEVWAPNAEIVVQNGDGMRTHIAPPPVQYFRGNVAGDPDSMVFLAVRADGATEGMILANDHRYTMRSRAKDDVVTEELATIDETPADGGFTCDLDQAPLVSGHGMPAVLEAASKLDPKTEGTLSGTGTWTLNVAVETDNELYVDLGSNAGTVAAFIGNVVGAASTIYKRDLSTDLVVAYSRIQTSVADPFTIIPGSSGLWNGSTVTYATSHALAELGDIWHNAGTRPYNGPRSSVVLLSGKNQTAGVAWIGTACGSDFSCSGGSCGALFDGHTGGGYAYIGLGNPTSTVPNPDLTNNGVPYGLPSTNYWPVLAFAHELGHNVNGPHTHCVALTAQNKADYGVTRNFIDECYAGQGGCFSGATSVPPEKGTIMSYCHLTFSGGFPQSRFLFGKSGEPSELMKNQIRTYINSHTPASPAITAPASMGPGASANASINGPVAGLTYDWTITNGTINGATAGTTINFTATTNPVTLRARGTNATGCAATDSVNVTVNSCVAPSITSQPQPVTITNGSSTTLSVAATGTATLNYQWYIGTSGNTSTPTGTNSSSLTVSPTSNTTYWVAVSNACGTANSNSVTVKVVDPPATGTSFYLVTPCRLLDTRNANGPSGGPAINPGTARTIQVSGVCGIPAGAKSITVNITAVNPPANGWFTLYASDVALPFTSTMNYRTANVRANYSIINLSSAGQINVYSFNSVGAAHAIVDVNGYFQ